MLVGRKADVPPRTTEVLIPFPSDPTLVNDIIPLIVGRAARSSDIPLRDGINRRIRDPDRGPHPKDKVHRAVNGVSIKSGRASCLPLDKALAVELGADVGEEGILVAGETAAVAAKLASLDGQCDGLRVDYWFSIGVGDIEVVYAVKG